MLARRSAATRRRTCASATCCSNRAAAREAEPHFRAAIDAHLPSAPTRISGSPAARPRATIRRPRRSDAARRRSASSPTIPSSSRTSVSCCRTAASPAARSRPCSARSRSIPTSTRRASAWRSPTPGPAGATRRRAEADELLRRLPPDAPQRPEVERLLGAVAIDPGIPWLEPIQRDLDSTRFGLRHILVRRSCVHYHASIFITLSGLFVTHDLWFITLLLAVRHCGRAGCVMHHLTVEASTGMKRIIVAMIALCALAPGDARVAQQTTGNIPGRIVDAQGAAVPGVTVTAKNAADRLHPHRRVTDARRHLSAERAAGRHLRPHAELPGFSRSSARASSSTSARRSTLNIDSEGRAACRRASRSPASRRSSRRRPRRSAASSTSEHREPAAQRPAVRQPGGDDSRRRPRLPLRPDQEHAVLAADRRRQRPQRQLPDRRRRQQRRHRRRPAAALPARGDPGVQLRHRALQGRVRPQQRRRDEHRHQERHEPHCRAAGFTLFRDNGDEREDRDREAERASTSRTTAAISSADRSAGRSCQNKAHFFAAAERTQQDTIQAVDTLGLFPARTASSRRRTARTW